MIKGRCYTNLDGYRVMDWPEVFVSVPLRGDYVEALDGKKILKVCGITHTTVKDMEFGTAFREPFILVELNK